MSNTTWVSIISRIVLGIGLLLVVFIFGPLAEIWALNTLFPNLSIPYTWETWLAAFVLLTPFSLGGVKGKLKKND